jgi:error-prone DNA polymerase
LRYVTGLRQAAAERLVEARRAGGPFASVDDLKRRAGLRAPELARLAEIGAFAPFGLERRAALWQAALAARPAGELFEESERRRRRLEKSPLAEMTPAEKTVADFQGTGMTLGPHPVTYVRAALDRQGVIPTAEMPKLARGTRTRIAGAVIVRQRPGTAKGALFLTVEDETGMAQAIVSASLLQRERATIVGYPGLIVEGIVESRDGSFTLRAERFWPLRVLETPSHDFR